jgi:tight adherence protein B
MLVALTFLAALLVFYSGYSILRDLYTHDPSHPSQQRLQELRERQRHHIKQTLAARRELPAEAEASHTPSWWVRLQQHVERIREQSGLPLTIRVLLSIMAGCACLGTIACGLFSGAWLASLAVGLAAGSLPWWFVCYRRTQRRELLIKQIPEAYELIARTVRAGRTVPQALQVVAQEAAPPLATEFGYCAGQQELGLAPEVALRDLAQRTGLLEIQVFVVALLVQRQSGGNLAEILESLATIIRSRFRVRERIKVMTAEGRLEATVLLALPPVTFIGMFLIDPVYTLVLLEHPRPLLGMFAVMMVGVLWIRKITHFDF